MNNKNFDWLSHIEEIPSRVYVFLAIIVLAIDTSLCAFAHTDPAITGIISIGAYGLISLTIYFIVRRRLNLYRIESSASEAQNKSVVYSFKNQLKIPYAVVNEQGKIITVNSAFALATKATGMTYNRDISELCSIKFDKLLEFVEADTLQNESEEFDGNIHLSNISDSQIAVIGECKYKVECYPLASKGKIYYMLVFYDITELVEINQRYKNHYAAVGYIVIDNLEEIAQYVRLSYQDQTREAGKLLAEWASEMGGILTEYESNKFLIVFTHEMLSECIRNKFAILGNIHKIEIGDAHIPLTVSMGIATIGETLEDRKHNAMVSLDMALQRGGDQVVLKTPTGIFYFGAKTKTLQKRTKGHAKIIFGKISSLIENSSNVIIMGHRNPDFDCIGACVGMATLIRSIYPETDIKIVADMESQNFKVSTERLCMLADYKDIFVDRNEAIEYNNTDTLLIIVDANNMAILESPELAKHSFKKVIIDHHIKKEEFDEQPELAYIDPSASSCCELIAEMLEESLPSEATFNEEATVMMSGIMLDTKNFTRTVGMRTFAAALYLKNAGADPEYARTFFEEGFDEYISEAQFGSAAKIYLDSIALSGVEGSGSPNDRVLAAKAADKLLTVKNVHAAFTMISTPAGVNVSARSDGSINVQLVLESVGGGGHFDSAGAYFAGATLEEAESTIIGAIDLYMSNLDEEKNND